MNGYWVWNGHLTRVGPIHLYLVASLLRDSFPFSLSPHGSIDSLKHSTNRVSLAIPDTSHILQTDILVLGKSGFLL